MLACVTLYHSVSCCMFLSACCSSHWLRQSDGGSRGPINGVGYGVRGNAGSSGGCRGQSHTAEERISGGRRGGRAWTFKVSDWPMRRSRPCAIATIVMPATASVCHCCDLTPLPTLHLHLRWLTDVVVHLSSRRVVSAAPLTKSSSVGGEICSLGRNDDDDDDKKRRSSFGARMMGMVGLGKKSQSASQLNPEGQSQFNQ